MKNAMLFFVGLVAGIAAANEPHEKGRLTLTFKESDPVGDFAEMKRRVPSSFDDKDDAGKDKPYNVSERTYSSRSARTPSRCLSPTTRANLLRSSCG